MERVQRANGQFNPIMIHNLKFKADFVQFLLEKRASRSAISYPIKVRKGLHVLYPNHRWRARTVPVETPRTLHVYVT